RPFVPVEPDTVSGPVRQARHLVTRSEAGIGDHFARRGVNRLAGRADLRRRERRRLRALLEVPHVDLTRRWLAEYRRAGDVRLIAVPADTVVDLDDVAVLEALRLDAAVRERRVLPERHGHGA